MACKHNQSVFGSLHMNQLQQQKLLPLGQKNVSSAQSVYSFNGQPFYQSKIVLEISLSEINRQQYVVTSNLLLGTPISELMRAKLRTWIYEQASAKLISRRTSCLAVTFIDLYLMKGGNVTTDNFHALGVSLLLLANKLTDNHNIVVDPLIFPRSQLFNFQKDFCFRTKYRLTPHTYVNMIDEILNAWNVFALRQTNLWVYSQISIIQEESYNSNLKMMDCRHYFELADTVYLVLKTFDFKVVHIVLSIIKNGLERDYRQFVNKSISIEDQVVISFWDNSQHPKLSFQTFDQIFEAFIDRIGNQSVTDGCAQAEKYVKTFVKNGLSTSFCPCQNEFNIQTINRNSYNVPKKTIKGFKANNSRKSSSETTF